MQIVREKQKHQFPFHVVRRMDVSKTKGWIIRIASVLGAFLIVSLFAMIIKPQSGSFVNFITKMWGGVFDPKDPEIFTQFLGTASILLLISLALLPAFKMKFWNIGAEGQLTIGCIISALITTYMPRSVNSGLVLILALLASIVGGIIWALLPAIFKAIFNTNEVLFTLMMNYIAIGIASIVIYTCNPGGNNTWGIIKNHQLPDLFGVPYLLIIIIAVVAAVLIWLYLSRTKHGYEISVVGESRNTARYVGINVKKVIIRTMILSGAICGFTGFLILTGSEHTLKSTIIGGQGFTGVMITWLGHFDVAQIAFFSVVSAFLSCGAFNASSYFGTQPVNIFAGIIIGLFFLIVIASEFFVNYKILRVRKVDAQKPIEANAEKGGC